MGTNLEFQKLFTSLDAEEKRDLAERANTSVAYLSQIANGHRKAGVDIIASLTNADNRITAAMLRPDRFGAAIAA